MTEARHPQKQTPDGKARLRIATGRVKIPPAEPGRVGYLVSELAGFANCDRSTIHRYIERGLIAADKRCGIFVVPVAEARRFLCGKPPP
jgi:hypothetical protein